MSKIKKKLWIAGSTEHVFFSVKNVLYTWNRLTAEGIFFSQFIRNLLLGRMNDNTKLCKKKVSLIYAMPVKEIAKLYKKKEQSSSD